MTDTHACTDGIGKELTMEDRINSSSEFIFLLKELRKARRFSQSRLAELADFDHSYVARLEGGSRHPTKDSVVRLAAAMECPEAERDALLMSVGYMPLNIESMFSDVPEVAAVLALMREDSVSTEVKHDVREVLRLLIRQAYHAAATDTPVVQLGLVIHS